ncbi:MAG: hypothetical protein JXB32_18520 [Deltaproteobacteria bacterium]|nr:hypothetical protein [Deltaproteobacteria bacterium]
MARARTQLLAHYDADPGGASIADSPHYLILNLGLNESYPITVPLTMRVDDVRHWRR